MRRKYGFMAALDFASWEPAKVVECLAGLGYQAVEWPLARFDPRSKGRDELRALVETTQRGGLEVSEIVVQQDLVCWGGVRRERLEVLKACIEGAAAAGVHCINLFSGPAPWLPDALRIPQDISEGEAWGLVLSAFEEFLPLAEREKVYLAVEAVFGHLCHDYYTTAELVRSFHSEYLAINMDPSHYQLYGNDLPWVVGKWGQRIRHVHLKDVVGRPGRPMQEFIFPLLGEGTIDWDAFVKALDEVGYDGYLSVEFESFAYYRKVLGGDPAMAAELSMAQIRRIFEGEG